MTQSSQIPTINLSDSLSIKRLATGLWQVAGGHGTIEIDAAVEAVGRFYRAGFTSFDMADHYGPAEEIVGAFLESLREEDGAKTTQVFTKWVPEPGDIDESSVRAAVDLSRRRLKSDRIDLLQFHWWDYLHPGYLPTMEILAKLKDEGVIGEIGLTNFDTAHMRILLQMGIPVVSNQVHFSLLDDRAAYDMADLCSEKGTKLLCYGTVAGGFLSDKWLGVPEPAAEEIAGNWSLMKYHRFIETIGGWDLFQELLQALSKIAKRYSVSLSNVAARWVLDHPAVAAILVGARLGLSDHIEDNMKIFSFELDDTDQAEITSVRERARRIPGDCGDEYRQPPYLTASGDLSDHKTRSWRVPLVAADDDPDTVTAKYSSGTVWEDTASYSRAVRRGRTIEVSGTTATLYGRVVPEGDAGAQAEVCIDKIAAALEALGGTLKDVVRTRIYVKNIADNWDAVARVHGRRFSGILPANTLVGADLVGSGYLVEMEAQAIVRE